jgi:hypothetical protein
LHQFHFLEKNAFVPSARTPFPWVAHGPFEKHLHHFYPMSAPPQAPWQAICRRTLPAANLSVAGLASRP